MAIEWKARTVKGDEVSPRFMQYGYVDGFHRFTATVEHWGKWGSFLMDFGPQRAYMTQGHKLFRGMPITFKASDVEDIELAKAMADEILQRPEKGTDK